MVIEDIVGWVSHRTGKVFKLKVKRVDEILKKFSIHEKHTSTFCISRISFRFFTSCHSLRITIFIIQFMMLNCIMMIHLFILIVSRIPLGQCWGDAGSGGCVVGWKQPIEHSMDQIINHSILWLNGWFVNQPMAQWLLWWWWLCYGLP